MKKPEHMLTGVAIGDFKFTPETFFDDIKKYGDGKIFNYLSMKTSVPENGDEPISPEFLYEAAAYMRDHGIYFTVRSDYRYLMTAPDPLYDKDVVRKLQEIAGEYFLGNEVLEFGGFYTSKARGYRLVKKGRRKNSEHYLSNPVAGLETAKEAKETYIRKIKEVIDPMREAGVNLVSALDAVTVFPYNFEAGVDFCTIEVAPRNMEQMMNFARGATRAARCNFLGGWCAHEWYAGYYNVDALKSKRLKLEYMTSYMAGLDSICLESGYADVHTYGDKLPENHPIVKENLRVTEDFARFTKKDERPGENGPITKIAFVQGNLDGFGWGNSSSLWGQYDEKKWGFAAPEFSYRVLDEVYKSAEWHDPKNSGDDDLSGNPAYGQYDVIPATCPLDVMRQYEWVIFCGWNTMTEEIYETLKAYVKGGGKLFITAAHMRDSVERDKKGSFVGGDLEDFLGLRITDEVINTNDGFKFERESLIPGMRYPGSIGLLCDPCWSAGYTNYVKTEEGGARVVCWLADSFAPSRERQMPIITENKYGEGTVVFMASSEYPGAPEIFPLYKIMVKSILAASHRTSDVKLVSSDKIRFAIYDGGDKYKIYILNTNYNFDEKVKIIYKGKTVTKTVKSIDFKIVEIKK